jgi:hypothetical protein
MAEGSIPQRVGTRLDVMLFTQDVLAHQHQVQVESYPSLDSHAVVVTDGAGARVALVGDREGLRQVLEAALEQLAPEVNDEPSAGE